MLLHVALLVPPLLLVLLLIFPGSTLAAELRITSETGFTNFVSVVNGGATYSGTTVFLDADLSLSGTVSPIGTNSSYQFLGVFDGQGHVISNLKISTSSQHAGLFGYSTGLTVRNVVLDDSCSITNSYSGSDLNHVGGIIGYCYATNDPCYIESNVNIASLTFEGSAYNLRLGGIIGDLYPSSSYSSHIKNCANYGPITHSKTSSCSWIGGIIGVLEDTSNYNYVRNCLNYGTIMHSGTTSSRLGLGGIAGFSNYAYIENCVSAGKVFTATTASGSYIGSIVGIIGTNAYMNYCYYTSYTGVSSLYGAGTPESTTGTPTTPSTINSDLVNNLNNRASSNAWNKWFLNLNITPVSFKVNTNNNFLLSSQLILLPDPAISGSLAFSGWYTDAYYTVPFQSDGATDGITLYGLYGLILNVTLNAMGGSVVPELKPVVSNGKYGDLPNPKRAGYAFAGWFTDENVNVTNETIVDMTSNHVLYARWIPNSYTVTFDFDNGTITSATFACGAPIVYPTVAKKEGCSLYWVNYHESMPAEDITITVRWMPNNYTVTFDFDNGTVVNEAFIYNTAIEYPKNARKEGYTLSWDSYIDFMPARDITITVLWIINQYVLTFDYGNGTNIVSVVDFDSDIKYPEDMVRDGYTFNRWDKFISKMPAKNLTITALWTSNSSNSLTLVVTCISTTLCIILAIVVVALLFFVITLKKKVDSNGDDIRRYELGKSLISSEETCTVPDVDLTTVPVPVSEEHFRAIAISEDEIESEVSSLKSTSILNNLYPMGYARPTMLDALITAELASKEAKLICNACENAGRIVASEGKLTDEFTEDDAAAIAMYTYDFGTKEIENNPYRIINRSLVGRNYAGLQKASGLLYLVMTALRKLPKVTGITLYRGVRGEVKLDKAHYYKGNVITWMGLSSTSPDMDATRKFLAQKSSKDKKKAGTLFIIEGGWGYDIQPYSLFPDEAEILLEPERQFRVISAISAEGMTIINLQMLKTPISLPYVFGSEWQ